MILLLISTLILITLNHNSNNEKMRWEDNYYTAIDSVNVIQTRNNELIYERDNFKLNYEELDKVSKQKIRQLENEFDKQIKYISELNGNIKVDTLIIKDSKVIGGLSGYSDTNTIMQVFADAGLKKN